MVVMAEQTCLRIQHVLQNMNGILASLLGKLNTISRNNFEPIEVTRLDGVINTSHGDITHTIKQVVRKINIRKFQKHYYYTNT